MRSLGMFVRIGSECNAVKKINGESTLEQISIYLLPALERIIVTHDPHHQNDVERVQVEADHIVVRALGIEAHTLSPLDRLARVNQDVAIQTASPKVRNLALIFRRESAHVALVVSMNMLVMTARGVTHPRGLPLLLGEIPPHLGAPAVEHLFKTLTKFVTLRKQVKLVDMVTNAFIHTHHLLLLPHLVLPRTKVKGQQTALHLSLFARGGPLPRGR